MCNVYSWLRDLNFCLICFRQSGFVSRFGEKQGLEGQVKTLCCWTLLALTISILTYFMWKRFKTPTY